MRQRGQYVARSAFKLLELHQAVGLIRPHACIVDLGAAPGGWIQAAREIERSSNIIGVDLVPLHPAVAALSGLVFIQGDMHAAETHARLEGALKQRTQDGKADVVLSDMLPNVSGSRARDALLSVDLCEAVVGFATTHLRPSDSPSLVIKALESGHLVEFEREVLRKRFKQARRVKPASSRSDSREVYLVATGVQQEEI